MCKAGSKGLRVGLEHQGSTFASLESRSGKGEGKRDEIKRSNVINSRHIIVRGTGDMIVLSGVV